ncbi:hypothetical protein WMW71_08685, partial [Flavobacterium buctense]
MKTFLQKSILIVFLTLFFFSNKAIAQTTYTWNRTVTASYTTSTNWTPTRTTPASTDVLQFNNGATFTVTDVPTQTIGRLLVTNNTKVTFSSPNPNGTYTTTIGGNASGDDLVVDSGCQLNLSGSRAEIISLLAGATGNITGNMTFTGAANQLLAANASSITFNSPAVFTAGTGFSGSAFGTTGTSNTVIFANGSTYVSAAGANPFGLTAPNSKVQFQTGSLFRLTQNAAPALNNRTYANFEVNGSGIVQSVTGASGVTMDNLTMTAGSLNLNTTGVNAVNIKGNISVASGATLGFNPAIGTNVLTFSGTIPQTITNAGTLTFGANEAVVIANTASPTPSVTFNNNQTISGSLTVNSGSILATSAILTNANPSVNGGLQLNSGGFVSATPTYGSASTLIYNRGSAIGHGVEWTGTGAPPVAGSGIPNNVTIQGNTSFTPTAARGLAGNLSIESGSSVLVNSSLNLTVRNSITNNGTLTLENNGNLLQVNNVANTGSGSTIVKRNSNPLIRLDYTMWSSPVANQNLLNFSPLTSISPNIRFYTYNPTINAPATTGFYQSVASPSTTPFDIGIGYLIRLPFNHPTAATVWNGQFTGTANNGTQNITISNSGDRFNSVGNPYPSPISISQFATDNSSNIETSIYFWRKTNNSFSPSYCSWNTASSTFSDNGEAF